MQKICLVILRKLLAVPVLSFLTHKAGGLQYMSCRFLSSHTYMFPQVCLLRLAMCSWHCIKHKGKEGLSHQRTFTLLSPHLLSQARRTANSWEQMTLSDTACKARCLMLEQQQRRARDAATSVSRTHGCCSAAESRPTLPTLLSHILDAA